MRIHKILLAMSAALLATLAIQIGLRYQDRPKPSLMAIWKDRPKTLAAAFRLADSVVEGEVVAIRRGEDLVVEPPEEARGEKRFAVPVEVVTIKVDKRHKGKTGADTIELFHTGHSDAPSPANRAPPDEPPPPRPANAVDPPRGGVALDAAKASTLMLHDDPSYKVGERYVFFVRKGPSVRVGGAALETQAVISPEGRYRVTAEKKLESATKLGFAGEIHGRELRELEAKFDEPEPLDFFPDVPRVRHFRLREEESSPTPNEPIRHEEEHSHKDH